MATSTYNLIASQVVGATSVSSITFLSIPQTYTDLAIKISARGDNANIYSLIYLRFNGATSDTNLSSKGLEGNGASPTTYSNPNLYLNAADGASATLNTFSSHDVYIPNYTSTTNKSVSVDGVLETNGTTAYSSIQTGLWITSYAINGVTIVNTSGNFVQYSSFYLYGITNH